MQATQITLFLCAEQVVILLANGIAPSLLQFRCRECFDTFCTVIFLNEYSFEIKNITSTTFVHTATLQLHAYIFDPDQPYMNILLTNLYGSENLGPPYEERLEYLSSARQSQEFQHLHR